MFWDKTFTNNLNRITIVSRVLKQMKSKDHSDVSGHFTFLQEGEMSSIGTSNDKILNKGRLNL